MGDRVFVDTWGWVALGHKKDSRHKEIVRYYREIQSSRAEGFIPVIMCWMN